MIGETLGTYRIVSEIGSGGMGVVYLAEHTLLGRKAALKLLRGDVSDELVERFFNEAKAAATLRHQGLVDVYDFGHAENGRAFIVMEFLEGESLAQRLEHEPRLPVAIACAIARSCAMALETAHKGGIVHRDLKPGNIFLVPDLEAAAGVRTKVLDFGIAKLQRQRESEHRGVQTQSGAVIGTPRYMSPEQCKNARNVDGRSDIYSLGCILYEMLLGVPPFEYDSWAELVGAHIYETPPRPTELDPNLPRDVETLVQKMLEKEPDRRFSSMQQLAESLEVILRGHGVAPVRLTPPSRLSTPPRGVRVGNAALDETIPPTGNNPPTPPPSQRSAAAIAPTMNVVNEAAAEAVAVPAAPRKQNWVAIGIGGAGAGALIVAGLLVLGGKHDKPEPDDQAYVVIERGSDSRQAAPPQDPPPPIAADAGPAGVSPDAAPEVTRPAPPLSDADRLTRTFAGRRGAISACFNSHPTTYAGQLSVRMTIDTAGTVTRSEVIPPEVDASELGACINDVARRTAFGARSSVATIRVPLVKL